MRGFWIGTSGFVCAIAIASSALAAIANFDGLPEGAVGLSLPLTDGGITFFDVDDYFGGPPATFVIEWAEESLGGPFFSPPNFLSMTGYAPGPTHAYARVGSFRMTTDGTRSTASMEVFYSDNSTNTIVLEATLNGKLTASDSFALSGTNTVGHHTMSISGAVFDELRLYGTGDYESGAWFGGVDNVVMVPEPAALVLMAPAAMLLFSRRAGVDIPHDCGDSSKRPFDGLSLCRRGCLVRVSAKTVSPL